MEKHIILQAELAPANRSCHDVAPMREGTLLMKNLTVSPAGRIAPCDKLLTAATGLKGYRPLGVVESASGRHAVLVNGNSVALANIAEPSAPRFLPLLTSNVTCAVNTAPGEMTLMTGSGPVMLQAKSDGTFTLEEFFTQPAPEVVTIGETTTLRCTVPRRKLSRLYERDERILDAPDRETLEKDLETARKTLIKQAEESGFNVLPVEYRRKVSDGHGRTLYESPVKLISGPRGYDFLDDIAYSITDNGSVSYRESFTVTATAFRIKTQSLL